jgi:polyhydroxyalkanoate synthesis regulator phasin
VDPAAIISIAATGAAVLGYTVRRIVDHLLGRGRLRIDEATKIRAELRADIDRKDLAIRGLEQRVDALEEELDKVERERNALDVQFAKYRLDVYRVLVEAGADRDLLNKVLAIQ